MKLWSFFKKETVIECTETVGELSTTIRVSSKDSGAAVDAFAVALGLLRNRAHR